MLLWQNEWQDGLVLLIVYLLVYHTESFPEVRGCRKGQEMIQRTIKRMCPLENNSFFQT